MNKIKNIKKKKIFILSSFGHSGIDWINSLLDNHPEILIIPSLSFFRKFEYIKSINKNYENLNEQTKIEIFCKHLFKQSKKKSLRYKFKNFKKKQLINNIYKNFKLVESQKFEIKLFYAIHLYFSELYKVKIDKIKIIVCHEHAPWNCKKYLKYFDAKLITVIRDPRASLAGSFRGYERTKVLNSGHRIEFSFSFLFHSIKNFTHFYKDKLYLISNEKFNKDLPKEMKKLSKWLQIKYNSSLLRQTFLGEVWYGETSYKSKNDLNKYVEKNYYDQKNVKRRWLDYLNDEEIKIIEILFRKIFRIGNYNKKFSLNFIQKISILFKFLFSGKFFVKKNNIHKYSFIKLILKKFLLILLQEKYTNINKLI
jgi:hypothetical protein